MLIRELCKKIFVLREEFITYINIMQSMSNRCMFYLIYVYFFLNTYIYIEYIYIYIYVYPHTHKVT